MDYTFNKTLLIILSLSSLLISSNAVPSTRVNDFISTSVPAAAPKSSSIDNTSTSNPDEDEAPLNDYNPDSDYPDAPALLPGFCKACEICKTPGAINIDPEILKICDEGEYEIKDCTNTLWKLMDDPFDGVKALEILVNDTYSIAMNQKRLLQFDCNPSEKISKDSLCVCRDQYGTIVDSLNKTLEILPQQNFVDAYKNMEALLSLEQTCHMSLTLSAPGVNRPWVSQPLREQIKISVNILSNILNKHINVYL